MPTQPDRLSLLRAKYRNMISEKRAELAELEQKIGLIDELEKESSDFKENPPPTVAGRYARVRLTDAVLDATKDGQKALIAEVRKRLLDNGFVPGGKNFTISVATTLKRLHGQGKLLTEMKKGKRYYWRFEPAERQVKFAIAS